MNEMLHSLKTNAQKGVYEESASSEVKNPTHGLRMAKECQT